MELAKESRERRQIAEFCTLLPRLRDAADKEGWAHLLEASEMRLREGSAPAEETLNDLWEYLGLRGIKRRGPVVNVALDGQDPLPPPKGTYRCPAAEENRRCARHELREPSGPVPECALRGLPLRFVT
jgi:hypothetical protein